MACAVTGVRNRANQPWMKTSTCHTAHKWKNMIRGSWLDVSLFSHVGKAIRDIWLVYIGLRTKICPAAFQCVNLSMYIINRRISGWERYSAFNCNFLTCYAGTTFSWVLSVRKKNLRIAGFIASIPFLTYLWSKRLKLSIHCTQLWRKIAQIVHK